MDKWGAQKNKNSQRMPGPGSMAGLDRSISFRRLDGGGIIGDAKPVVARSVTSRVSSLFVQYFNCRRGLFFRYRSIAR